MSTALSAARRADILAQLGVTAYVRRLPAAPMVESVATPPAVPPSVCFAYDPDDAGEAPLRGAYARLLGDVLAALGAPTAVHWHAGTPDVDAAQTIVGFGIAPRRAARAILAPPLAALRLSATAKRALWRDLRVLARRGA
jgi:hypothetical protein